MSSKQAKEEKKELSLEAKRKQKLLEKSSVSAGARFKEFLSGKNKK